MIKTKLRISYTQKYDTHKDKQHSIVEATIGERNGSTYLLFKEVDAGTNTVIDNMIKIKAGEVTVKRTGGIKSELVFNIAKDYKTLYNTPYGEFELDVVTKEIYTKFEEEEVSLKIRYDMHISGQRTSKNIYEIQRIK